MKQSLFIKSSAICCETPELLSIYGLSAVGIDKDLLPAGLRRRCSLTTKMVVTAATLAYQQADLENQHLPSIFSSIGGEMQITDALCRALPDKTALISPTQFHNSVHNTSAGYWSILTKNQAASTAIAARDDSFAMGLIESYSQLQSNGGDLLLVCYDEQWADYLAPPLGKTGFACAFILSCEAKGVEIALPQQFNELLNLSSQLQTFIESTPAAIVIPLLQAIKQQTTHQHIALSLTQPAWFTQILSNNE